MVHECMRARMISYLLWLLLMVNINIKACVHGAWCLHTCIVLVVVVGCFATIRTEALTL